jgi:hypothetical protein
VSRKRLTTWVLVLAVGMTARITVAAPRASMAEIRAIVCCMKHCPDEPRRPMTPHRCCSVESAADDPAGTTPAASLERPAATPLATLAAMPLLPAPTSRIALREAPPLRAGPPGFLDTQKLRC